MVVLPITVTNGRWKVSGRSGSNIIRSDRMARYRIWCDSGGEVEILVIPGHLNSDGDLYILEEGSSVDLDAQRIEVRYAGPRDFAEGQYACLAVFDR